MSKLTLAIAFATTVIGSTAFAEDISGTWKNIDRGGPTCLNN